MSRCSLLIVGVVKSGSVGVVLRGSTDVVERGSESALEGLERGSSDEFRRGSDSVGVVLRASSSMVGRGSEDALGRGLVDVVDPIDWLVGDGGAKGKTNMIEYAQLNRILTASIIYITVFA